MLKNLVAKLVLVVLVFSSFPHLATSSSLSNEASNLCQDLGYVKEIKSLWKKRKPIYQQWISASDKTPYNLYNVQGETNNLLKYSEACNDRYILNELVSLYIKAIDTLDETSQYAFYYYPADKRRSINSLGRKYKMWLDEKTPIGDESILVSAQFLALISETINIIVRIDFEERSSVMSRFIGKFFPVLMEHYIRWIFAEVGPFQVRGWGCKVGSKYVKTGMNHHGFLRKKMNWQLGDKKSPSYCNAVDDADLWILAGVSNILGAAKMDRSLLFIGERDFDRLRSHLEVGLKLLEMRITEKSLTAFDGKKSIGANFDLGAWDDHYTYQHAGIDSSSAVNISRISGKKPGIKIGWDISHARRFVHVFDSLYRNKESLGMGFPSEALMKKLSNQLLYGVFNGDFTQPLFTNFMDGTNGWFRVNYSGKKGFGFAPWDMSSSVLTGGFGFWSIYNKDIEVLFKAVIDMLKSDDPGVKQHVEEHYEKSFWYNYEREKRSNFKDRENTYTQSILIQLIPSMCFQSINKPSLNIGRNNEKHTAH